MLNLGAQEVILWRSVDTGSDHHLMAKMQSGIVSNGMGESSTSKGFC